MSLKDIASFSFLQNVQTKFKAQQKGEKCREY